MAGFQVIMYGRFWVITEGFIRERECNDIPLFNPSGFL
jgi:hypothetical protein